MCASRFPSAVYYGPDFTFIYNEGFKEMMPTLHPWSLGKPCWEVWQEGFDEVFVTRFKQVMKGIPTCQEEHEIFITRDSAIEQTFFSWALNPIVDEKGVCAGISNISVDLTARVLASRSFQMFGEIGTRMSAVTNRDEFWGTFLAALQTNQADAPFALVYSRVSDFTESSSYSGSDDRESNSDFAIQYEGSYNIPEGHICIPSRINLDESDEGFAAAFREACGRDFLYLRGDDLLPSYLLEGLNSPFGDPVVAVAIAPIYAHSALGEISGFLVLGLNTRRPFNNDYQLFVRLLVRQLSTSLSTSLFFETEARRNKNLARMAAMEKIILSNQLAVKTSEARASEARFKRFTEIAPVGIYMCDQVGRVTFVNDAWFEITAVPRDFDVENWIEYVHPEDREGLFAGLANIGEAQEPVVQCVRWIKPYTTKDGQVTDRWTVGMSRPEYSEDGALMGYLGVTTSIAEQKLRESTQKKLLEDARELKRQQDNFVDIASHEMRNPLPAVLQLSDTIISSLSSLEKYYGKIDQKLEDEISASIDAAQTILLCANHQKRIVDDILTLSKLDSARLVITPVDVQPIAVVNEAIKMFEQDCLVNDIHMSLKVDEQYWNLSVDWVKLDPTRLLQVLINLLTNAMKSIRSEVVRKIILTLSASSRQPRHLEGLMVFPSVRKLGETSPQGEPIRETPEDSFFLYFEVKDTGKGYE
ncbi:hypothetical protein TWF694_007177 [Orbilia ellipsospora]|uniref:Uncharacterized protein n=1 Tax=Orbilia ellipsospora TaxID=2528407 RepID=A0AAV9XJN2_9PEZI